MSNAMNMANVMGSVTMPDAKSFEVTAQHTLTHGPSTRGFGYCCQIFEMGDFTRVVNAATILAQTTDGIDDKRVLELLTQSIVNKCQGHANMLATTEPEQKMVAKALARAGFKRTGKFLGVRDRIITLWLKVREERNKEEGGEEE